jgi:sec-independent protein translocase protein TatB
MQFKNLWLLIKLVCSERIRAFCALYVVKSAVIMGLLKYRYGFNFMFEVGFSELVMVGLVSLLVIGPERLPKVARVVGFWIGKMQQMVTSVKLEISQELHAEEIRQLLKENETMYQLDDKIAEKTLSDAATHSTSPAISKTPQSHE